MSNEYKLSYTASQIDEKLGKIDKLVASVNGVKPDSNGNVNINVSGGGGSAIIDVIELPTENIREDVFYRLMTADFVYYNSHTGIQIPSPHICYCVNELPQTGTVVTDLLMSRLIGYYNMSDGIVYGYVDATLGNAFGVPASWYPFEALAQIAGLGFNGIITDANDIVKDNEYYSLLLSKVFYIYQNGWCKVPFAYEKAPEFDIQWDGVIGDRFVLDVTAMSDTTTYMVKVSEQVLSAEQLIDGKLFQANGWQNSIEEGYIDFNTFSGAFTIWGGGAAVVYNADEFGSILGAPAGYITNGVYFVYVPDENNYTNRLVAPSKITKIDSKYLDIDMNDFSNLATVARTGNYNDLYNKPAALLYDARYSLSSQYQKNVRDTINVYSKSEVDTKIANAGGNVDLTSYAKTSDVQSLIASAIGGAIGGSY